MVDLDSTELPRNESQEGVGPTEGQSSKTVGTRILAFPQSALAKIGTRSSQWAIWTEAHDGSSCSIPPDPPLFAMRSGVKPQLDRPSAQSRSGVEVRSRRLPDRHAVPELSERLGVAVG